VIRHYGTEGLSYHIGEHLRLARLFAGWISESSGFELFSQPPFNLVCFRHRKGNEHNKMLMDKLNQSGRIFLTHTVLDGTFWLRMSIGQTQTREEHVQKAWELIKTTSRSIFQEGSLN